MDNLNHVQINYYDEYNNSNNYKRLILRNAAGFLKLILRKVDNINKIDH